MSILTVGPPHFTPQLIIFDKDGTLIDFHAMWATWLSALARQLELRSQRALSAQLYQRMGYDAATQRIAPDGSLALWPMTELRKLTAEVLCASGFSCAQSESLLADAWFVPDAVRDARPLTDLPNLFARLRAHGVQIAVATSDDRVPTDATLQALGLWPYVNALICADEHLPIKPAADMILHLCSLLHVHPSHTVMIGDSVDDMRMGRAAQVALCVGVLSGVSSAARLTPHADALIDSIAQLLV